MKIARMDKRLELLKPVLSEDGYGVSVHRESLGGTEAYGLCRAAGTGYAHEPGRTSFPIASLNENTAGMARSVCCGNVCGRYR